VAAENITLKENHVHGIGNGLFRKASAIFAAQCSDVVVEGNRIDNVIGFGILLQNAKAGHIVLNNLIHDVSQTALCIDLGDDIRVSNNILAMSGKSQLRVGSVGSRAVLSFTEAIVVFESGELFDGAIDATPSRFVFDHNDYWKIGNSTLSVKDSTFEKWKSSGQDSYSILTNPQFADLEKRDFRLESNVSTDQIGFRPLSLHLMGVYDWFSNVPAASARLDVVMPSDSAVVEEGFENGWDTPLLRSASVFQRGSEVVIMERDGGGHVLKATSEADNSI
jgi:hypothetical protein